MARRGETMSAYVWGKSRTGQWHSRWYSFIVYIGVWLSLVERYVRDVEVACSNPVTPTIKSRMAFAILLFIFRVVEFERACPQSPEHGT